MKTPFSRITSIAVALLMVGNIVRAASGDAFLNAANFSSLRVFNPTTNVLVDLSAGN